MELYTELKDNMEKMVELFDTRMNDFQANLSSPKGTPNDITALSSEFASFKLCIWKAVTMLRNQMDLLLKLQDRNETSSRRKFLLFHGVAENKDENLCAVVTNFIRSQLPEQNFTAEAISRCSRPGLKAFDPAKKPRAIIVKFKNIEMRDSVWFNKKSLKGTGVIISEFLTKFRHDLFMAARNKFGMSKCWTRNGLVHIIAPDGSRHKIETLVEMNKIAAPSELSTRPAPKRPIAATAVAGNQRPRRNVVAKNK